ncbi:MAG: hypothetical protein WCO37_12580, partial [Bacteroidota bacterium]
ICKTLSATARRNNADTNAKKKNKKMPTAPNFFSLHTNGTFAFALPIFPPLAKSKEPFIAPRSPPSNLVSLNQSNILISP